jgi:TonB family protein
MSDKSTFSSLMIRILMTFCILACCPVFNQQAAPQTELRKQEQEKSADASCVAEDKPKPDVLLRLGILNGKTLKMPKPKYPVEAKRKGIAGEVKVEVVIDINSGVIEWAKLLTGDPLLQEAVSKVICQAKFPPTNDLDGRASGYLIYKFHPPRKTA